MKHSLLTGLMAFGVLATSAFAQPDIYDSAWYTGGGPAGPSAYPSPIVLGSGWYIGLNGGWTQHNATFYRQYSGQEIWALTSPTWRPSGYNVNPVVGYDLFSPCMIPVRLEVSGTYYNSRSRNIFGVLVVPPGVPLSEGQQTHDVFRAWTLIGNFYIDWHTASPLTPYLGVGAGAARIRTSRNGGFAGFPESFATTKHSETHFTWNAILGASYFINANLAILAQASFTDLGKVGYYTPNGGPPFYLDKHWFAYSADVGIRLSFC